MTAYQIQQFDGIGEYSFIYEQDDVRIYPYKMNVKVALEKGDIIGFNARDYLISHQDRTIEDATLTVDEAREHVNGQVNIQEEHVALVENNVNEEVLAYEVLGRMDSEMLRIFINV